LFLEENNYPQHYHNLIGTKSTSDDEVDSSGLKANREPVHLIKKWRERSVRSRFGLDALTSKGSKVLAMGANDGRRGHV
jgi:hypothetical protein